MLLKHSCFFLFLYAQIRVNGQYTVYIFIYSFFDVFTGSNMDIPDKELSDLLDFSAVCTQSCVQFGFTDFW